MNIDGMGAIFRQGNADEVLHHALGIFCTFKDEFQKNVSKEA